MSRCYRWYAEMPESRGSKSATKYHNAFTRAFLQNVIALGFRHNCVAVPLNGDGQPLWIPGTLMMDAYAGVNDQSNAPVAGTTVEQAYLRRRCLRITPGMVEKLHPNLFNYLKDLT